MRSVFRAALAKAVVAVALVPAAGAEPLAPGAAACLACHTAGGNLADLASLYPGDIAAALAAYRNGARAGTVMPRIAKGFSAEEARAIAETLGRNGAVR